MLDREGWGPRPCSCRITLLANGNLFVGIVVYRNGVLRSGRRGRAVALAIGNNTPAFYI